MTTKWLTVTVLGIFLLIWVVLFVLIACTRYSVGYGISWR